MKYMICYSITSEESAANGDYEESGIIGEPDSLYFALRELYETRTNECGGVESECGEYHNGRLTLYVQNSMEYRTGCYESRSLHVHGITRASAKRIARAAGITLD